MTTVKPFGVVLEVVRNEKTQYVILPNDFERFKTFGNWNLQTEPIEVLGEDFKPIEFDEDEISEIINDYVVNEKSDDDD